MVTNRGSSSFVARAKGFVVNTIFCAGRGVGSTDHADNIDNGGGSSGMVDNDVGGVVNNSGGVVNNSCGGVKNSAGGSVNNSGDVVNNSGDAVNNGGGDVIYSSGSVNDSGGGMVINGGEVVLVVQGRHIPASRRTLALVSNFFKVCCS
jgi:hypothetical protein